LAVFENKEIRKAVALEVEAKFSVPDTATFQRLLKTSTLAGFVLGDMEVAELHDHYLDTADGSVRAGGYACRMRQRGDRYLITLKGQDGTNGAVHRRTEYEVELPAPLAPRDWPASPARDLVLSLCDAKPLMPLFEIEQTRHTRILSDRDRAVAELDLDHVVILFPGTLQPNATYLELEAELLPNGKEEDLSRLVTDLQEAWGLTPQGLSKFQRGLARLNAGDPRNQQNLEGTGRRLSGEERTVIEKLTQEREVIARRARLLLAWDDGLSRAEIVARSGLSPRRVRFWLRAFGQLRLGIFPDRVRPVQGERQATAAEPLAVSAVEPVEQVAPPTETPELLKEPGVEPDDPMSEAGRKILRFHYRRMLYNEPAARLGEDIEALHDMRVATRRLRAAFRVFADYYDPDSVAPYVKGLKRTGRTLGAVRDLDVFEAKIQAYLEILPESHRGGLNDLLAVLEEQRTIARERMIAYLDSKKFRRFVEQFGEFTETQGLGSLAAGPSVAEPHPYRVRHVAPMAIYERLAEVRAYDDWVSVPNPTTTRLHALRIACKKLRYTVEFFEEVLGRNARTLIKETVSMQDHLGDLHDAVVASGILRDFLIWGTWGHGADKQAIDWQAPVIAPGVAAYLAATQTELQQLLDTFPEAWQRLQGPKFARLVAGAVSVL
jgi:CHAD domain-containing protein